MLMCVARKRAIASRKSGVCRASALTRAPSAMPWSKDLAVELVEELLGERQRGGAARRRARRASSPASRSRSASGTTRETQTRSACASAAVSSRPVSTRSSAAFSPASRRSMVITIAGTKPRWISGYPTCALGPREHDVARGHEPRPAGERPALHHRDHRLGQLPACRSNSAPSRSAAASLLGGVRSAEASSSSRSAPAQKSLPAPRSTTTRTSASRSAASSACVQRLDQRRAERVALVGAVEREGEDAARRSADAQRGRPSAHPRASRRASAAGTGISIRSSAVE